MLGWGHTKTKFPSTQPSNAYGIYTTGISQFKHMGNPAMLTEEMKDYFTELLTQRLNELLAEDNETVNDINSLSENNPDPSDRATMEVERDVNFRMRDSETVLMEKIKEALERIENGTHGICEECEQQISKGRLKARPVATLCIACKRRKETQEKARGL